LKDVPAELPDGLKLGVFPERDDPSDSLLSNYYSDLSSLPKNSSIGTSSLRRQAQLLALRPDLKIYPLRGNLDTRVKKLERGDFDAIVVASVGLKRLKIQAKQNYKFPLESFLPAIGQGALGIEYLEENIALDTMLQKINHLDTKVAILAERSFLHELEGGCQVPIAGYAEIIEENKLIMRGLVADIYGTKIVKREACSDLDKAKDLGRNLAREVLKSGGDEILKEIYT
jgi:hydroxymethylbilane synthase